MVRDAPHRFNRILRSCRSITLILWSLWLGACGGASGPGEWSDFDEEQFFGASRVSPNRDGTWTVWWQAPSIFEGVTFKVYSRAESEAWDFNIPPVGTTLGSNWTSTDLRLKGNTCFVVRVAQGDSFVDGNTHEVCTLHQAYSFGGLDELVSLKDGSYLLKWTYPPFDGARFQVLSRQDDSASLIPIGVSNSFTYKTKPLALTDKVCFVVRHQIEGFPADVNTKELCTYKATETKFAGLREITSGASTEITAWWQAFESETAAGYVVYLGQDFKQEVARVSGNLVCSPQERLGTQGNWCSYTLKGLRHGVVYSLGVRVYDIYGREDANLEVKSFDLSNHAPSVSKVEVVQTGTSGRPEAIECRSTYTDSDTWQVLQPTFVFKNRKREQIGDVELSRVTGLPGQISASYTLRDDDRRGDVLLCEVTVDDGFGGKTTVSSAPDNAAQGIGRSLVVPGRPVLGTGLADLFALRNTVIDVSIARGPSSCTTSSTDCVLKGYSSADSDSAMQIQINAVKNGNVCVPSIDIPCTMSQSSALPGQTTTGYAPFTCEADGVCKFRFIPAKDHFSQPEDRESWARIDYQVKTPDITLPDGTVVPGSTSEEKSFFLNIRPSPRATGFSFKDGNQDVPFVGTVLRDYSPGLLTWLGYQHQLPITKMYTRISADVANMPNERPNGEFDPTQPGTICTQEPDETNALKFLRCEIACRAPTTQELLTAYGNQAPTGTSLASLSACPFVFKPNPAYYGPAVFYYALVDSNGITSDYARGEIVFQPSLRATGYAATVLQDETIKIEMKEDPADPTAPRSGFSGTLDPVGDRRIAISGIEVTNTQVQFGALPEPMPGFLCADSVCSLTLSNRAAAPGWPGYGIASFQYRVLGYDAALQKSVTSNWCPKKENTDPNDCNVSLHFYPRPVNTGLSLGVVEQEAVTISISPGDLSGASGYHHPYAGVRAQTMTISQSDPKGTIAELPSGTGTVNCAAGICPITFASKENPCNGAWNLCTANIQYNVTVKAPAESGLAANKQEIDASATGTLSLHIRPVPKATGLALKAIEGKALSVTLARNNGYTYDLPVDAHAVVVGQLSRGTLLNNTFTCAGATCSAQFIPEPNYSGPASIEYHVVVYDEVLKRDVTSAPNTISIDIRPIPKATGLSGGNKIISVQGQSREFAIRPGSLAQGLGYSHAENIRAKSINTTSSKVASLAGVTDVGTLLTRGSGQRFDCDSSGTGACTGTFQPALVSGDWLGYGEGRFNYSVTVFDPIFGGDIESETATAFVDVRPLPQAIGSHSETKGLPELLVVENSPRTFALELNRGYTHPYNSKATSMLIGGSENGTAVAKACDVNGRCEFTFTPAQNYSGTSANFTYRVQVADPLVNFEPYNGTLDSANTIATVNVFPRPVVANMVVNGQQNKPRTIEIALDKTATPASEGYTHAQGSLAFCVVTKNPARGSISAFVCNAEGTCQATFTPEAGYYSDNQNPSDRAGFDFQVVTKKDGLPADTVGLCPGQALGLPLVASNSFARVEINVRPIPVATGLTVVDIQGQPVPIVLRQGPGLGYEDRASPARPASAARRISEIPAEYGTLSPFTCATDQQTCTATFTPKLDTVTNTHWYGDLNFTYAVSMDDELLGAVESEAATATLRIRPKAIAKDLSLAVKQGSDLPVALSFGTQEINTYNHPYSYRAYKVLVSDLAYGVLKNESNSDGFSCNSDGRCDSTFKPNSSPQFYWGPAAQFKYRVVVDDPILKAARGGGAGDGDIASDLRTAAIDIRPVPEPTGLPGYLSIAEGSSLPIVLRWGLIGETNGYSHGDNSFQLPAYDIPVTIPQGFLGSLSTFSCSQASGDCSASFTTPSTGTSWGNTSFSYRVRVNDPKLGILQSYTEKTIDIKIKPFPKATGRSVKGVQGIPKPISIEIGKGWDYPASQLSGLSDPGLDIITSAVTNGSLAPFTCVKSTGQCTSTFTPASADFYGPASFAYKVRVFDPDLNELISTEKTYAIDFYPTPKAFSLLKSAGKHIKGTEATARSFELLLTKPQDSGYVFCNTADAAKGLPQAYAHPYCEPAAEVIVVPGSVSNASFDSNPAFSCNATGACAGTLLPNTSAGGWNGYGVSQFQYRIRINPAALANAELSAAEINALTSDPATAEVEFYPIPKTRNTEYWGVEGFASTYFFDKCNGTPIENCDKSYVHGYDRPASLLLPSNMVNLKAAGPFLCDPNGRCSGLVEAAAGYYSVGANPLDRASFDFTVKVEESFSNSSKAFFKIYPRPHAQNLAVEGVQAEDLEIIVSNGAGYTHADGGTASFLEFMAPEGGAPFDSVLCPNSTTNTNCFPCSSQGVCTLKFKPGTTSMPFAAYFGAAKVYFRVLMDGPPGMPAELRPALVSEWAEAAITILPKPIALNADLVVRQDQSRAFSLGVASPTTVAYSHPLNAPATKISVLNGIVNGQRLDLNTTRIDGHLVNKDFSCSAGSCSNVFAPNSGFYGQTNFQFKVNVSNNTRLWSDNSGTINIDVRPLPVASNVQTIAVEGEVVPIEIGQGQGYSHPYNNGFNVPNLPFPLLSITPSQESRGTLSGISCNQSCTALFTPQAGWVPTAANNKASFSFTTNVNDPKLGDLTSATQGFYQIEYRPLPRATDLNLVTIEGEPKTVTLQLNSGYTHAHGLLAKDIQITNLNQLSVSSASCNTDTGLCSVVLQPNAGFFGNASFQYRIRVEDSVLPAGKRDLWSPLASATVDVRPKPKALGLVLKGVESTAQGWSMGPEVGGSPSWSVAYSHPYFASQPTVYRAQTIHVKDLSNGSLSGSGVTCAAGACTISCNSDGVCAATYTPSSIGTFTFTYNVSVLDPILGATITSLDGNGTIHVRPTPQAKDLSVYAAQTKVGETRQKTLRFGLGELGYDDINASPKRLISSVELVNTSNLNGTLTAIDCTTSQGVCSTKYQPNANFLGTASFTFKVRTLDAILGTEVSSFNTAVASIVIRPRPVSAPFTRFMVENVSPDWDVTDTIPIVLNNDQDKGYKQAHDLKAFALVGSSPVQGTLSSTSCNETTGDCTIAFKPNNNFSGQASIDYRVKVRDPLLDAEDNVLESDNATLPILVKARPRASNVTRYLKQAEVATIQLSAGNGYSHSGSLPATSVEVKTWDNTKLASAPVFTCTDGVCSAQITLKDASTLGTAVVTYQVKVSDPDLGSELHSNTGTLNLVIRAVPRIASGAVRNAATPEAEEIAVTLSRGDAYFYDDQAAWDGGINSTVKLWLTGASKGKIGGQRAANINCAADGVCSFVYVPDATVFGVDTLTYSISISDPLLGGEQISAQSGQIKIDIRPKPHTKQVVGPMVYENVSGNANGEGRDISIKIDEDYTYVYQDQTSQFDTLQLTVSSPSKGRFFDGTSLVTSHTVTCTTDKTCKVRYVPDSDQTGTAEFTYQIKLRDKVLNQTLVSPETTKVSLDIFPAPTCTDQTVQVNQYSNASLTLSKGAGWNHARNGYPAIDAFRDGTPQNGDLTSTDKRFSCLNGTCIATFAPSDPGFYSQTPDNANHKGQIFFKVGVIGDAALGTLYSKAACSYAVTFYPFPVTHERANIARFEGTSVQYLAELGDFYSHPWGTKADRLRVVANTHLAPINGQVVTQDDGSALDASSEAACNQDTGTCAVRFVVNPSNKQYGITNCDAATASVTMRVRVGGLWSNSTASSKNESGSKFCLNVRPQPVLDSNKSFAVREGSSIPASDFRIKENSGYKSAGVSFTFPDCKSWRLPLLNPAGQVYTTPLGSVTITGAGTDTSKSPVECAASYSSTGYGTDNIAYTMTLTDRVLGDIEYKLPLIATLGYEYPRLLVDVRPKPRTTGKTLFLVENAAGFTAAQSIPFSKQAWADSAGKNGYRHPYDNGNGSYSASAIATSGVSGGTVEATGCNVETGVCEVQFRPNNDLTGANAAQFDYTITVQDPNLNPSAFPYNINDLIASDAGRTVISIKPRPRTPVANAPVLYRIQGDSNVQVSLTKGTQYTHPNLRANNVLIKSYNNLSVPSTNCDADGNCIVTISPSPAQHVGDTSFTYAVTVRDPDLNVDLESPQTNPTARVQFRPRPTIGTAPSGLVTSEVTPIAVTFNNGQHFTYSNQFENPPAANQVKLKVFNAVGGTFGGNTSTTIDCSTSCSVTFTPLADFYSSADGSSNLASFSYTVEVTDPALGQVITPAGGASGSVNVEVRARPSTRNIPTSGTILVYENTSTPISLTRIGSGVSSEGLGYPYHASAALRDSLVLDVQGASKGSFSGASAADGLSCSDDNELRCEVNYATAIGEKDGATFSYRTRVFDTRAVAGGAWLASLNASGQVAWSTVSLDIYPRPVCNTPLDVVMLQDSSSTIILKQGQGLGYTHDRSHVATEATANNVSFGSVAASLVSCVAGDCSVSFTPTAGYFTAQDGSNKAGFDFNVKVGGIFDDQTCRQTISVKPRPLTKPPVGIKVVETQPTSITIAKNANESDSSGYWHPYTDARGLATAISIKASSGGTVGSASCTNGTCTLWFTASEGSGPDSYGDNKASITYTITTDGVESSQGTLSLNVRPAPKIQDLRFGVNAPAFKLIEGDTPTVSIGIDLNTYLYGAAGVTQVQPNGVQFSLVEGADSANVSCGQPHCDLTITPTADFTRNSANGPTMKLRFRVSVQDGSATVWSHPSSDTTTWALMEFDIAPRPRATGLTSTEGREGSTLSLVFDRGSSLADKKGYTHLLNLNANSITVTDCVNCTVEPADCSTPGTTGRCTLAVSPVASFSQIAGSPNPPGEASTYNHSNKPFGWAKITYRVRVIDPIKGAVDTFSNQPGTAWVYFRPVPKVLPMADVLDGIEAEAYTVQIKPNEGYSYGRLDDRKPTAMAVSSPSLGTTVTSPICNSTTGICTAVFTPPSNNPTYGLFQFRYKVRVTDPDGVEVWSDENTLGTARVEFRARPRVQNLGVAQIAQGHNTSRDYVLESCRTDGTFDTQYTPRFEINQGSVVDYLPTATTGYYHFQNVLPMAGADGLTVDNLTNLSVQSKNCAGSSCSIDLRHTCLSESNPGPIDASFRFRIKDNRGLDALNTATASFQIRPRVTATDVSYPKGDGTQGIVGEAKSVVIKAGNGQGYNHLLNRKATQVQIVSVTGLSSPAAGSTVACDGSGVCTFSISSTTADGTASLKYRVLTEDGFQSYTLGTLSSYFFSRPLATTVSTRVAQDSSNNPITIQLNAGYTHPSGEKATEIEVTDTQFLQGALSSQRFACNAIGVCTVQYTPQSGFSSTTPYNVKFKYKVYMGSVASIIDGEAVIDVYPKAIARNVKVEWLEDIGNPNANNGQNFRIQFQKGDSAPNYSAREVDFSDFTKSIVGVSIQTGSGSFSNNFSCTNAGECTASFTPGNGVTSSSPSNPAVTIAYKIRLSKDGVNIDSDTASIDVFIQPRPKAHDVIITQYEDETKTYLFGDSEDLNASPMKVQAFQYGWEASSISLQRLTDAASPITLGSFGADRTLSIGSNYPSAPPVTTAFTFKVTAAAPFYQAAAAQNGTATLIIARLMSAQDVTPPTVSQFGSDVVSVPVQLARGSAWTDARNPTTATATAVEFDANKGGTDGYQCTGKPANEVLQGSLSAFSSTDGGVNFSATFNSVAGGSGYRCWRYRMKREVAGRTLYSNFAEIQIYVKPEDRPAAVCDKVKAGRIFSDPGADAHGTTVISYPQQARTVIAKADSCAADGWYLDPDNGGADKAKNLVFTTLPSGGSITGCTSAPCSIACDANGICSFTYNPPAKVAAAGTSDFYTFAYKVTTFNATMNREAESPLAQGRFEVIEPPTPEVKNLGFNINEDDGVSLSIANQQNGTYFNSLEQMGLRNGSDGYPWVLQSVTVTSCTIEMTTQLPLNLGCNADNSSCGGSLSTYADYPGTAASGTFSCSWKMRVNNVDSGNGSINVNVAAVYDPPNTIGKNQTLDSGDSYWTTDRVSEFLHWWGEADLQGTWKNTPVTIGIKGTNFAWGAGTENNNGWYAVSKFGYVTRDASHATHVKVKPSTFSRVKSLKSYTCSNGVCTEGLTACTPSSIDESPECTFTCPGDGYCSLRFTPEDNYEGGNATFRYLVRTCYRHDSNQCAWSPIWSKWAVEVARPHSFAAKPVLKPGNLEVAAGGSTTSLVVQYTGTNPPTQAGTYYQAQFKGERGWNPWWPTRSATGAAFTNLVGINNPTASIVCSPSAESGVCIGQMQSAPGFVGLGGADMTITTGDGFCYQNPANIEWNPSIPVEKCFGNRLVSTSDPQRWNVTVKALPIATGLTVTAIRNTPLTITLKRGAGLGYTHAANLPAQSITIDNSADFKGSSLTNFVCDYQGAMPSGDCTATFTPGNNFTGTVTLDYYVTDSSVPTAYSSPNPGVITIKVQPSILVSNLSRSDITEGSDTVVTLSRISYPSDGGNFSGEGYAHASNQNASSLSITNLVNGSLIGTGSSCTGTPLVCTVNCADDGDNDNSKCTTTFRPSSTGFYGEASFNYKVTVNDVSSDDPPAKATLTYKARPILKSTPLELTAEQGASLPITIAFDANTSGEFGYSHPTNGRATALTITDTTNLDITANSCDGQTGSCTLTIKRNPNNTSGLSSFRYNVTVGALQAVSSRLVNVHFSERPTTLALNATTDRDSTLVLTLKNGTGFTMNTGALVSQVQTQNPQNGATVDTGGSASSLFSCTNGECVLRFRPNVNYAGNAASFQFRVYNGQVASDWQTANIKVDGEPTTSPVNITGGIGATASFVLLYPSVGYSDPNNDFAVAVETRNVQQGSVNTFSCDSSGICTTSFTPNSNVTGNASFEFRVTTRDTSRQPAVNKVSGWSILSLATVAADEPPSATSKLITNAGRTQVQVSMSLDDGYTDPNGDRATGLSFSQISGGTLSTPNCNAITGVCTTVFNASSGVFGEAYARYTVTANGKTSQNSGLLTIRFGSNNPVGCFISASTGAISLDPKCALTVPVTMTLDSCTITDTQGSISGLSSGSVTSNSSGLFADLQEFSERNFAVSYIATSDQDDLMQLNRSLRMTAATPSLLGLPELVSTPTRAQGMEGIQRPYDSCTGSCRLDYGSSTPETDAGASLAVGEGFACSAKDAQVHCWGRNDRGQLGAGFTGQDDVGIATQVDFAAAGISTGVAAVAAGGGHACAVLTSGEVACWGRNDKGQLGNKTTIDSDRPVLVQRSTGTLSNIVAVALGAQHSCALSANRNVWCWGDGAEGKLGTPSLENRAFAASVKVNGTAGAANLSNALAIDLGPHHACAIQQQTDSTRKLLCWGRNTQGEHALGESQVTRVISHASLTLSGIDAGNDSVSIANHGLQNGDTAILESSQGSLSAGTIYYIKATSADVFEFHTSTALNSKLDLTGGETGASIKFSSLFASNSHGLTNGTALSIVATSLPSGVSASTVLHVVQASEHFFRLSTSVGGSFLQPTSLGTGLSVMRIYPYPQAFKSSAAVDVTEAAQVVAGSGFTCVLRTNRTVLCAGANTRGATGQGTSGGSAAWATAVKDSTGSGTLGEVVGLAAGANHVCSIMKDRQMQCWGGGTSGQLGASQSADSTLPLPVNTGSRLAFAVAAGYENSCALLRQGTNDTVSCWGSNSDLQLADTLSQSSQTTATTSVRTHAEAIFTPRSRYCSTVYQVTPLP